jgi:hydroxymethylpyrimidine pyrophosphatase-like HAD family hydrolase
MEIKLVVFDLAGTTIHDNQDVHRILQGALNMPLKNGFKRYMLYLWKI